MAKPLTKRHTKYGMQKIQALFDEPYQRCFWSLWNYDLLKNVLPIRKTGNGDHAVYDNCIITLDTETSKLHPDHYAYDPHKKKNVIVPQNNIVVMFTISIRAYGKNVVTLWGKNPEDCMRCLESVLANLQGQKAIIYVHNLAYDYTFLRRFLFKHFGYPEHELCTKPHYPINIKWDRFELRDTLILFQKKLEKVANDYDVEHKKAVGKWDYEKIRSQHEEYSEDELDYAEHDTLALAECIDKEIQILDKMIYALPYTATGIIREQVFKAGGMAAHKQYEKQLLDYAEQCFIETVFHGGFTHGNRAFIDQLITWPVQCYDFSSSYPFCLLAYKYPAGKFMPMDHQPSFKTILKNADEYASMFTLSCEYVELKDPEEGFPTLQASKCVHLENPVIDNGRVLCGHNVSININEIDLQVLDKMYLFVNPTITNYKYTTKDYLPRWYTDIIYKLYYNKTTLKDAGDPVNYQNEKTKINGCYGQAVQKPLKDDIEEDYETGEYHEKAFADPEAEYKKVTSKITKVLPYQVGVFCTSFAFRNVITLSRCCEVPLYADTDSVFGYNWDQEKLLKYTEHCKNLLAKNGYKPFTYKGKEFCPGVPELDKETNEFKYLGAKRYCYRDLKGKLHITVAGVPKNGVSCLKDDINNFKKGFIFKGTETGKLQHNYMFVDDIFEKDGNIIGDSIDLSPCDYALDAIEEMDLEKLYNEDIEMEDFEEWEKMQD